MTPQLYTLGGEAHALIGGLPELRPVRQRSHSNRLTAEHAHPVVIEHIENEVLRDLRGPNGERPPRSGPAAIPREDAEERSANSVLRAGVSRCALLIPVARSAREPLQHHRSVALGALEDLQRSAGLRRALVLLLPPGWEAYNGRPLEEIAAFQWESANRIVLDDLGP